MQTVRRVVTVSLATIGGLALLASFHTTPGIGTRSLGHGRSALQPPAGGPPPTNGTSPNIGATAPATKPTTDGTAGHPGAAATRTIVGPVVSNPYGPVQVEVVVRNGQLSDVEALELPSDRDRSRYINGIAGPELRQEALQARSANINVISGATYTSAGYAQSLQQALDQAGL
jgi:hypothetical protein